MKIQSAPFGLLLSVLLLVPGTPARAQTAAPAAEVVWSATNDFGGKMMDIDRFDNVYSVGDTIVGGIVLTRKFNPDGFLLWERSYRPEFAVKATWVAADPNGGAYVVGYKWTGSNQSAIGYFVLRYDADGNLVWTDISDGGAAMAVRAVADLAGNAYVTGGLYVAGSFTIGIVKYSPKARGSGSARRSIRTATAFPARPSRPASTCPRTAARSPPRAPAGTTTTCCPATSPGSSDSRTSATIPSTPPESRSTIRARCISATAWPAAWACRSRSTPPRAPCSGPTSIPRAITSTASRSTRWAT